MADVTVSITIANADVARVREVYGPGTPAECLARLQADLAGYLANKVQEYHKNQAAYTASKDIVRPTIS